MEIETKCVENMTILIKYNGKDIKVDWLLPDDKIEDLKGFLFSITEIDPENQKLIGLKSKVQDDIVSGSTKLSEINFPKGNKVLLMGTPTSILQKILDIPLEDNQDIIDEVEFDQRSLSICQQPEYLAKVEKRCKTYKITQLNPTRADKYLLVLDIDYTIYDHRSSAESVKELMRPFLHEFLTTVYPFFDIAIWSATKGKWIMAKLLEMGLINSSSLYPIENGNVDTSIEGENGQIAFQICMVLDYEAMITVYLPGKGLKDIKPLQVIWHNFPQWSSANTIMFDDIKRNFLMNPQSGLRIDPYRNCHMNRSKDTTLLELSKYLFLIAMKGEDFNNLKHKKWKKYVEKNLKK